MKVANHFFPWQKLCIFVLLPASDFAYDTPDDDKSLSEHIFNQCKDQKEELLRPNRNTINVARSKPVTASSLLDSATYPTSMLTNGNTNDFAHTELEDNPWFEIDLGGDYIVDHITVHNRKKCSESTRARANNFKLELFDASRKALTFHGPNDMSNVDRADFDLFSEEQGLLTNNTWCFLTRYVKVQIPTHNYLNLAEVEVFAFDRRQTSVTDDESTLKYGQKMKLYLPDYHSIYLTGCRGGSNDNTEMRFWGKEIFGGNADFTVKSGYPEEGKMNHHALKKGRGATYPNNGKCVRYGEPLILQNNYRDDRFLTFFRGNRHATTEPTDSYYRYEYFGVRGPRLYWIFRSVDRGNDPSEGECIRQHEHIFIQNFKEKHLYLHGWYGNDQSDDGAAAGAVTPINNDPKYFKWAMKMDTQQSKKCKAQNVKGRWVNTGFTNGVSTATREYGVLEGQSSSYTSENYWQQSVSASMSVGFGFGSASLSVTSSVGEAVSRSVESAKDVTTTSTIEHTFNDAGVVWQFVYDVDDSCYQKTTIAGEQLVMTPSLKEKPCCVPPFFLDVNNPHGPCVDGTPCDCAPEICNPLEEKTNMTSLDLPAHSLQYGQVLYLENSARQGHYLSGGRGVKGQRTFTKEKENWVQEENKLGYYQWTIRSSVGKTGTPHDVDPKEDDCVRYGEYVYLQANGMQDRYLKFNGAAEVSSSAQTDMPNPYSNLFLWKPRSVGAGLYSQDVQEGECIILDGSVDVFLQNVASSNWLGGGQDVGDQHVREVWTSVKPAAHVTHHSHFIWKLRKTYHNYANTACRVKDIVGGWEYKLISNGDVSVTQEYGVVKKEQLTNSRKRDWEVEVTATAEGGIGSASASVSRTSTIGGSQSHEVSRTAQQSNIETYQIDFDGGGLVWQYVYNINDGCDTKLKTRSMVLTKSVVETPCCNPGTFLNPKVVHGPCIEGAPCFCGEEVCNAAPAEIGTCDCDKYDENSINHLLCDQLFEKYGMCLLSMI